MGFNNLVGGGLSQAGYGLYGSLFGSQAGLFNSAEQLQNQQRAFCTAYPTPLPGSFFEAHEQLRQFRQRELSCGERIERAVEGIKSEINREIEIESIG